MTEPDVTEALAFAKTHRPNYVTEEIGPKPLHWRTRVKCDGDDCGFYAEDESWFRALDAHSEHVAGLLAPHMGVDAAGEVDWRTTALGYRDEVGDVREMWNEDRARLRLALARADAAERVVAAVEAKCQEFIEADDLSRWGDHGKRFAASDILAVSHYFGPRRHVGTTEDGQANDCRHDSATGVDAAPIGPGKVWRCDHCGLTWTDAARTQAQREEKGRACAREDEGSTRP